MDHVLMARVLFALTLAFHIIFSTLGVGMPFMILVAELTHHWTKDSDYAVMAKRWTKGFTVLLAVGITSGTTVALQLSLLWPKFMYLVGQVIALPFLLEIFAFFIEALFMSIYVYARDKIPPSWRIVSVAMVAIGAGLSAVLITDANAFMNTPQGFQIQNGQVFNVHPWEAVFNPSFPTKASHVLASAYMTVAFITGAVAAAGLWKLKKHSREREHQYKALFLSLFLGGAFGLFTVIFGDLSGKFLAVFQPEKLAAGEGLFHTTAYAPFEFGGWVSIVQQKVVGGIGIPGVLSWLSTGHFQGVVKGLNDFPRDTWPPLYIHLFFDAMITIGTFLIAVAVFAWGLRRLKKNEIEPFSRWFILVLIASGPLAMIGIESGWIYAEVGRQPWVVYHLMRTSEAVTTASHMGFVFTLFIILYFLLAIGTVLVMRGYFRRHPLIEEIEQGKVKSKREVWLP